MASRPRSLHEHLLDQFGRFDCPPHVRRFGEYLIQNLDHNGRLQSSLAEIVQVYGEPVSHEDAHLALSLIQRCDPPGVGARDVRECLLLQITPETPCRDVLITLVSLHLENVAQNRLTVIQRMTGHSLEVIKAAIEELKQLEPLPGRGFEIRSVWRVVPDIEVERDNEGQYTVKLLDEYTPRFHSSSDQKWKTDSAKWLIESIEQRNNTLRKVAQAIVDHQREFLDKGPESIAPLKMQRIADKVRVHVTAVSRAVEDKWIQTPHGLFPLRRFFGGHT